MPDAPTREQTARPRRLDVRRARSSNAWASSSPSGPPSASSRTDAGRGQHPAVRPPARRGVRGARRDPRVARRRAARRARRIAVGIEINATHHRAARSGSVTGVATRSASAARSAPGEVAITDDDGPLVCTVPHHLPAAGRTRPGQDLRRPDTSWRRPLSTARRRAERPSWADDAVSRPSRRRRTDTCAIRRVTTGWKPSRA